MPDPKPLELDDQDLFDRYLRLDPPQISELTFTNLFMWRQHYHPLWRSVHDCLTVILRPEGRAPVGLPPLGPGNKSAALTALFEHLREFTADPRVARADDAFVEKWVDPAGFRAEPDPDQSDYVYRVRDLIELAGRKYHQKKNHLNYFLKNIRFECRPLGPELVGDVLNMQESWCALRACAENPGLNAEDTAVYEALSHFGRLNYNGLAMIIDGRVEAFALGERLNPNTAVVHIEKANPDIRGLHAAVNRMYCSEIIPDIEYVNREQDLGVEGLRRAKQSYYPHHMVNKYVLTAAGR